MGKFGDAVLQFYNSHYECLKGKVFKNSKHTILLYPDSGISMDEEFVLGDMIWSYNKTEL